MLSMFLTILVVNNGFQVAYINMQEIQAIELVDVDSNVGLKARNEIFPVNPKEKSLFIKGILTITLKGNKTEDLAFNCTNEEQWEQTKDFLVKSMLDINRQMTRNNLDVKVDKDPF